MAKLNLLCMESRNRSKRLVTNVGPVSESAYIPVSKRKWFIKWLSHSHTIRLLDSSWRGFY